MQEKKPKKMEIYPSSLIEPESNQTKNIDARPQTKEKPTLQRQTQRKETKTQPQNSNQAQYTTPDLP